MVVVVVDGVDGVESVLCCLWLSRQYAWKIAPRISTHRNKTISQSNGCEWAAAAATRNLYRLRLSWRISRHKLCRKEVTSLGWEEEGLVGDTDEIWWCGYGAFCVQLRSLIMHIPIIICFYIFIFLFAPHSTLSLLLCIVHLDLLVFLNSMLLAFVQKILLEFT